LSSKARERIIGGPLSTTPVTTTDWTTSPILDTTEAIKQGEGQDVEAHPFALGALGEPAMERFRRAQLPFAAVAFGRFDRGRRDPAGGPRTKRKPKRRLLIRKWYGLAPMCRAMLPGFLPMEHPTRSRMSAVDGNGIPWTSA
jgi:hypothetical protein